MGGVRWVAQMRVSSACPATGMSTRGNPWRLCPRSADSGNFVALSVESIEAVHVRVAFSLRKFSKGEPASLVRPSFGGH